MSDNANQRFANFTSVKEFAQVIPQMIVKFNNEAATHYLQRYRATHPTATPREALDALESRFWKLASASGGSVGAIASVPAVGTVPAIGLSTLEMVGFTEASIFYIIARAELYGYPTDDPVRRQTLVMTILLGGAGEQILHRAVPRTSRHWSKAVLTRIPASSLKAANSVLGRNMITKYGAKQGVLVLGRAIPLGIGAVIGGTAGALGARTVMAAADKAFGDPPDTFPVVSEVVRPDPDDGSRISSDDGGQPPDLVTT